MLKVACFESSAKKTIMEHTTFCCMWIILPLSVKLMIEFLVQELTLEEAESIALSILKQVMEEKVKTSIQFSCAVIPVTKNSCEVSGV
jgi:hypothetical protein